MAPAKPLALIIEDDPASAEALALTLRDFGAEVMHSRDGSVSMEAVESRIQELKWIITDYHLGAGPDGVSLARRLKLSAPQARVLVLSGSFHGKAATAAQNAGYEVMQKPARADTIVAWLKRA